MRPWLTYTLIRLGVFAAALALLAFLTPAIPLWVSAVIAAVVGLCVSYIFFGDLRRRMVEDLAARRNRPEERSDEAAEDAV